ncbi:MAG TPA: hypothetical protein VGE05_03400 [Novosphingobium sp.]
MIQMIETNWLAFALALLIGLLVAWWLFGRVSRDTRRREYRPDVLDEGVAPAQRNQALIDQPATIVAPPPATGAMGGIGEVIAAAAAEEVAEVRAAVEASSSSSVAAEGGDDLRRIKGVGPKLAALLHSLGITSYAQVAAWTDADIDRIDAKLGTFAGRIRRDSWVEQAKLLAGGDTVGFEAKFGKL